MKPDRKQILLMSGAVACGVVAVAVAAWGLVRPVPAEPQDDTQLTALVRISEDGFSPATLKIKAGTAVVWMNDDTEEHRVAANPFGSHTELPELDSKTSISPNSIFTFSFAKSGIFHYHDETDPKHNGTVVVE